MQVGFALPIRFRERYKSAMPCELLSALRQSKTWAFPHCQSYSVLQQLNPQPLAHHQAHICSPKTILHPAVLLPDPACQAEMFGISCKITTSCIWWGRARTREQNRVL